MTERGEIVWTPPADVRATSRIGAFLDWLADSTADLRFDGYPDLWHWSVDDLDGVLARACAEWSGVRWHDAPSTAARPSAAMPGARVVPGRHAQLRRARAARRRRRGPTTSRSSPAARPARRAELTWAELADARGAVPRRAACASASGRATAWPRTCPNIPETLVAFLATAQPGRDLVVVRARVRRRARWSTASRRSSRSCSSPSTATATARRPSTSAPRSRRSRPRCRTRAPHACTCRVPRRDGRRRLDAALARRARRPARVRARAVRPPALRAVQLGHDRAAEGDRARARRHHRRAPQERSRCTTTSAPATASSGSPPPAG